MEGASGNYGQNQYRVQSSLDLYKKEESKSVVELVDGEYVGSKEFSSGFLDQDATTMGGSGSSPRAAGYVFNQAVFRKGKPTKKQTLDLFEAIKFQETMVQVAKEAKQKFPQFPVRQILQKDGKNEIVVIFSKGEIASSSGERSKQVKKLEEVAKLFLSPFQDVSLAVKFKFGEKKKEEERTGSVAVVFGEERTENAKDAKIEGAVIYKAKGDRKEEKKLLGGTEEKKNPRFGSYYKGDEVEEIVMSYVQEEEYIPNKKGSEHNIFPKIHIEQKVVQNGYDKRRLIVERKMPGNHFLNLFKTKHSKKLFWQKMVIHYFRLLVKALGTGHKLGIGYADFKPGNTLLMDPNKIFQKLDGTGFDEKKFYELMEVYLIDTTFYKDPESPMSMQEFLETMGIIIRSTLAYLSPEMREDINNYTAKSDIWSLGMVFLDQAILKVPIGHDHPERNPAHELFEKKSIVNDGKVEERLYPKKVSDLTEDLLHKVFQKVEEFVKRDKDIGRQETRLYFLGLAKSCLKPNPLKRPSTDDVDPEFDRLYQQFLRFTKTADTPDGV